MHLVRKAKSSLSLIIVLAICASAPQLADAQLGGPRADSHAPIGVMGDHMHLSDEFMLSYRFMNMNMDGSRSGSERISDAEVLEDFMVTPTEMDMQMHMVGAMYALNDDLTLMAMVPFLRNDMNHLTRMGGNFETKTSGISDVSLSGMYRLYGSDTHQLHLNAGLSFPTGSIDERDDTPMGNVVLPYPMQLGSGTYDLLPGLTYFGFSESWSWGAQFRSTVRLGTNDEGYRLGNRYGLTTFGQRKLSKNVSTSLRLDWQHTRNIHGSDDRLNPMVVPTADPDLRGGDRIDLGIGLNLLGLDGWVRDHRLGVEFLFPVYQSLDGPQLEVDWTFIVGWQKTWF